MKTVATLLAALLFTLPAAAQGKPLKKVNAIDIPEGKYHLELPDKYNAKNPTPVIVFLHGKTIDLEIDNAVGQLGNDFVLRMKRLGYVAVCPVMPKEHRPHWWENGGSLKIVDAMMEDVKKKVNVSYMLLSGFSAGANYSLAFGQHRNHHQHFAGYLCMAGGANIDVRAVADVKAKPSWLGCGDVDNDSFSDTLNTTGGARKTSADLKAAGFVTYYDEFPKVGHDMDKKMVDKAMAFVSANTATFQAIGALQRATVLGQRPGDVISQLEASTKVKPADYWKDRIAKELETRLASAKSAITEAESFTDAAKAKEELNKLANEYRDSSVEKMVREALERVVNRK